MGASSLADPPLGAWDAESGPKRIAQLQDQLCSLRTEWELQARRSRQLLAAFQLKLEEKEMELRTARLVVDRQMRDVTTNLLQVEANLRREKRLVLELLAERDQLIRDQRFEMGRLKALNKQLMQEKLNGSSSTTSPSSSSSSTTIMSNGSSSPSEIAESVISRDSTNLSAAAPHATPTKAATNGGIQANGCKRWRSDSDVLTPNMKVVRVGSAVSFLLNKSECSESHSSTEDLSWQKGKQRSWQLPSSQANSSSSCSIVNTISHVLDSTFSSSSSSPAAVSNNISSPPNTSSSSSTSSSSAAAAAGDGRGSDPNSNEDTNRLLSSSSSSSCLHTDLMSPDAALLDDSLDQSDSGFFSSSGQRTPEAGVPTPPLPARSHHHHHHHPQNNKPPWIPPKPDHLVTKLKGIKAGKDAKVASSVVSKGKLGGILKKTSVSEPNLLSSRNLVMKEAVPKRPSKTRLTLSTSSGNLTEGIVQANFEEFHLDFPPAASPSSTSSSGSDYHSTTSGGSSSRRPGTPHQVRDGAETSGCETDDDASTKSAPASGSAAGAGGSSDTTANKLVHFSGSYEKFLEATGLSQKSIIVHRPTPNNNHRSVVKPKDVKNRSKLNKLSVFHDNHNQGLLDQQPVTGLVKYWTEPYL